VKKVIASLLLNIHKNDGFFAAEKNTHHPISILEWWSDSDEAFATHGALPHT
jgi:hypothetical protein